LSSLGSILASSFDRCDKVGVSLQQIMVLETAIHIHKPEPSPHRSSSNIEFQEPKREEQEEEPPLIPSPRQEAGDVAPPLKEDTKKVGTYLQMWAALWRHDDPNNSLGLNKALA
jgi:hypothetical protein